MSEKNIKNTFNFKKTLIKSCITVLIISAVAVALSVLFAFLLSLTPTPEIFYDYSGYIILAIASYSAVKLYLKKICENKLTMVILSTFLSIIIISLTGLAQNHGSIPLLPLIVKTAIIFLFMSLALNSKNKRKKNITKRR